MILLWLLHLLVIFLKWPNILQSPLLFFQTPVIEKPQPDARRHANYRSGVDGLRVSNTKGGTTFAASTTQNGIHMITAALGVEAADFPWSMVVFRLLSSITTWSELVSIVVKVKEDLLGKVRQVLWMGPDCFSCCKRLLYRRKQGSQTEPKVQFKSTQESFQAPVKSGTILEKYTTLIQINRTWLNFLEDQEPTVDMVAGTIE